MALDHASRASLDVLRGTAALADLQDPDGPPTVAVVLGAGSATAKDASIAAAVAACQQALVPVLGVCTDVRRYQRQIPPPLWPVNGRAWPQGTPPDALSAVVLQVVGLADTDRRVFLSHCRSDGSALAEQLRTALADERWDVFLDRFSVPPADGFQERIDRELADKAFVLLLETPLRPAADGSSTRWCSLCGTASASSASRCRRRHAGSCSRPSTTLGASASPRPTSTGGVPC